MFLLSGFGILFSILLLFYNRGYRSANLFLGLFLILFNFVLLSHFIYVFSDSKVTVAFFLSIPLNATSYLIGPLAFFYVRSILKDDSYFTKYDWLHFILFAIIFIGRLSFNVSDWNDKLLIAEDIIFNSRNGLSYPDLNNFLTMNVNYKMKGIHFIIYLVVIWYNLLKSKTKSRFLLTTSRQEKIVITWLIFFVTIISFLGVFFLLYGLLLSRLIISHYLKLSYFFSMRTIIRKFLQFSLYNSLRSVINKLKSRFTAALRLKLTMRRRLTFIFLYTVSLSFHN